MSVRRQLAAVLAAVVLFATDVPATTITIANGDGAEEGFNDSTPVAPVGGNAGVTLGQQRLIAFNYAAAQWETLIASSIVISVAAEFSPLSCSTTSATLGSAGPVSVFRDFAGAPLPNTWFPVALANHLAGALIEIPGRHRRRLGKRQRVTREGRMEEGKSENP